MFRGQDGEVAKPGMGVQASLKGMNKLGSGEHPGLLQFRDSICHSASRSGSNVSCQSKRSTGYRLREMGASLS